MFACKVSAFVSSENQQKDGVRFWCLKQNEYSGRNQDRILYRRINFLFLKSVLSGRASQFICKRVKSNCLSLFCMANSASFRNPSCSDRCFHIFFPSSPIPVPSKLVWIVSRTASLFVIAPNDKCSDLQPTPEALSNPVSCCFPSEGFYTNIKVCSVFIEEF